MKRSRNQIYQEILHFGLLHIRAAAHMKNCYMCEIEADHLHNIPMLLGEPREEKHRFYYEQERGLYLEKYSKIKAVDTFYLQRFEALWDELSGHL